MARIFLQSLLSLLITILLITNLAMTFNIVNSIFSFAPPLDWSDKYVGLSTFIDYFRGTDWQYNSLNSFNSYINSCNAYLTGVLNGSALVRTSFGFLDFIINFFQYLTVPFMLFFNMVLYVAYVLLVAFWFLINTIRFMSGGYYSTLPQDAYAFMYI